MDIDLHSHEILANQRVRDETIMMKRTAIFLIAALAPFAAITAAQAGTISFCSETCDANGQNCSDICASGKAVNQTKVPKDIAPVVGKVTVHQLEGNGCAKAEVSDGSNLQKGEATKLALDRNCDYRVRFNIKSSGCTGDKDIRINKDDIKKGNTVAALHGACGSLNTELHSYKGETDTE